MMFGLMRVRTHDAEMAKVRAEQRMTGKALREALDECEFQTLQAETNAVLLSRAHETIDTLQTRLDALTPARGQGGEELCLRDRKLIEAIGDGSRTFQVAARMSWGTPMTRRALYRLEKAGLIQRDAKHSAVNDVRWLPTPPETTA